MVFINFYRIRYLYVYRFRKIHIVDHFYIPFTFFPISLLSLHSAEIDLFLSTLLKIGQTRPRPSAYVDHIYTGEGRQNDVARMNERDGSMHTRRKIYHVTNTKSVRRRVCTYPSGVYQTSLLPHRAMQSMLNRITINCINSKNSTDSKHRPSAHNRRRASLRRIQRPSISSQQFYGENL